MRSELAHRVRSAIALLEPRALAARPFRCPGCGPSVLVRFARHPIGVRCLRCGASGISLSIMTVLGDILRGRRVDAAYELSSRGPVVEFLRPRVGHLTCSEYLEDVAPGRSRDGVRSEDVQRLTFGDGTFDLCTSTEVFEHVADDIRGFREVRRVLRPGGRFIFTVPLTDQPTTVERARLVNGRVEHLLPPEYHGDRIRGRHQVLAFRNYGGDITGRLRAAGFGDAVVDWRCRHAFLGFGSAVVIARVEPAQVQQRARRDATGR